MEKLMRLWFHSPRNGHCTLRVLSCLALLNLPGLSGCGSSSSGIPSTTRFVQKATLGQAGAQPGQFIAPGGLAVDATHVYIVDNGRYSNGTYQGDRIEIFRRDGTFVSQFTPLDLPLKVATDGKGNLYVPNASLLTPPSTPLDVTKLGHISIYRSDGTFVRSIYGDSPLALIDIAVDAQGTVYEADLGTGVYGGVVKVFSAGGTLMRSFGTPARPSGGFTRPLAITLDSSDNIYVADLDNFGENASETVTVQVFKNDGTYLRSVGGTGSGGPGLLNPTSLSVDARGNLYVLTQTATNNQVQVYKSDGTYLTQFTSGLTSNRSIYSSAPGLATTPEGNVYVADNIGQHVALFKPGN
jgi:hypothetical protein